MIMEILTTSFLFTCQCTPLCGFFLFVWCLVEGGGRSLVRQPMSFCRSFLECCFYIFLLLLLSSILVLGFGSLFEETNGTSFRTQPDNL